MIVKRYFAVVQSLSCVQLFVTPWTTAHQASLSCSHLLNYIDMSKYIKSSKLCYAL